VYFGVFFLFTLIILVVVDVSIRSLSLQPFIGTIELVRCCLIWSVFISLRYTTREGGHIRMGELMARFPEKLQYIVAITWRIFAVIVFGIISISAITATARNLYTSTEALQIPYWIFFFPTVVGFILVTIQYIVMLVGFIKENQTKYNL
jgi:TRAP-type C4-dicarboxylate transport system permease small subunit